VCRICCCCVTCRRYCSVRDVFHGCSVVFVGWVREIWKTKRNRALVRESDGDDNSYGMTSIIWKRCRGRRILLADRYYLVVCVSQDDQVFMLLVDMMTTRF